MICINSTALREKSDEEADKQGTFPHFPNSFTAWSLWREPRNSILGIAQLVLGVLVPFKPCHCCWNDANCQPSVPQNLMDTMESMKKAVGVLESEASFFFFRFLLMGSWSWDKPGSD